MEKGVLVGAQVGSPLRPRSETHSFCDHSRRPGLSQVFLLSQVLSTPLPTYIAKHHSLVEISLRNVKYKFFDPPPHLEYVKSIIKSITCVVAPPYSSEKVEEEEEEDYEEV